MSKITVPTISVLLIISTSAAQADQYLDVFANERITERQQEMPYFPPPGAYEPRSTGAPLQYEPQNRVTICQTTEIGTACNR